MDLTQCTRRWLLLAEKLLTKEYIEECHEVCNEVEFMIKDMKLNGIDDKEIKFSEQKARHIRRMLNNIIAGEIRKNTKNIYCTI